MKKKALVFPLIFAFLAACSNTSSSVSTSNNPTSNNPTTSVTPTTSSSTISSNHTTSNSTSSSISSNVTKGEIELFDAEGHLESCSVKFRPVEGAVKYEAFINNILSSSSVINDVKVDDELIRDYGDYYRVDVLGLKKGTYSVTIKATFKDNTSISELSPAMQVESHIREGFAFKNGSSSGAYDDSGVLKSNAEVIYIYENTKDTVSMNVTGATENPCVGLQNILNGFKKGKDLRPLCIRLVGNITDFAVLEKGDLLVDNCSNGITIEGVGEDATANGWGLRIKNSSNVEVRNLGFMNCDSAEGDNISLQQDNDHVWIHNNDLFYGEAGSDADQNKGDGALDTKTSSYVTHSFNHFFDSGKCNLQGMKSETTENYITYHHNYYDHSDSRHPRVRTCTVHIYNNYYDGISKYGVGSTMGSSLFVENNYFENSNNPMLTSMQGTDKGTFSSENGGVIKSFGNKFDNTNKGIPYSTSDKVDFDFYDASSRDEVVPSTVLAKKGGTSYNNFDTNSSIMYEYNVQTPDAAKETVIEYAGRVNGGDFKFAFTDADDTSYAINSELKSMLKNYKTSLIGMAFGEPVNNDDDDNDKDDGDIDTPIISDTVSHNFETLVDPNGYFVSKGTKYTKLGTKATFEGVTYASGLKIQSATILEFVTTETKTLTLIVCSRNDNGVGDIKIDGESYAINGTAKDVPIKLVITIEAGTHQITRGSAEAGLYYIEVK